METRTAPLMALVLILALGTACTKERSPEFPDGEGQNIFAIGELTKAKVSVTPSQTPNMTAKEANRQGFRAGGEMSVFKLTAPDVVAPDRIKPMFADLNITGLSGNQYEIQFELNRKYLTAFKVVNDRAQISEQERQISAPIDGALKGAKVPLFQYPIQDYGTLVRKKNDLNEETHLLRLEKTEWENVTHVQLSTRASDRILIEAPSRIEQDSIFVKGRLDGEIFTKAQLFEIFDLKVNAEDGSLFLVAVDGKNLRLFKVTTFDELEPEQQEIVSAQDASGDFRTDLTRCGSALLKKLGSQASSGCVIVESFTKDIIYVAAELHKEGNFETGKIKFIEVAADKTNLVKIDPAKKLNKIVTSKQVNELMPERTLLVREMKKGEWMIRRTLQDSPNGFDFTFTGSAGPLEIVKFVFEKDRLRIVRANPLVSGNGTGEVDLETFISIPAFYFKLETKDANGNSLTVPKIVPTDYRNPDAIAYVNWAENEVPKVLSPINYYELEQCFMRIGVRKISQMDSRQRKGVLNFSLSTTYASNPSLDCSGLYQAGYFDKAQANFTFKERISFKRYDKPKGEQPLLGVPYEAQKALGFGLFTYHKKVPNKFGNIHKDGSEIPLPAVFNIQNGETIDYTLAGIPEAGAERDRIIKATKEVVADINEGFKKAFAGTPMERKGDVVTLKIEGVDTNAGVLGDLDKNFIYYVQKRTSSGVIGLGGSHSNPRSGQVEAASVFLYGGNIKGFVQRLRELEDARKIYDAIHGVAAPSGESQGESGGETVEGLKTGPVASLSPVAPLSQIVMDAKKLSALVKDRSFHNEVHAHHEKAKALGKLGGAIDPSIFDSARKHRGQLAFYRAYMKAVQEGKLNDPWSVETYMNEALVEVLRGQISHEKLRQLRARTFQRKAIAKVFDRMRQNNICLYRAPTAMSGVRKDVSKMSDLDLLEAVYKPTLAHEIGHNLGLRHNFISSYDKANWKHTEEEETSRNYSSVMDYLPDDHFSYDGLGPQDVSAIRAAYAGLVELGETARENVLEKDGVHFIPISPTHAIRVFEGKYIDVEAYRMLLGKKSWIDFNEADVARLPLKKYLFCSDEDAGLYPTCNRFDSGSTPSEIVQSRIDDYRALYMVRNFPNDRLKFEWWDAGSYVGRLFGMMIPARQFLEELFYQLINRASSETIQAHADAAIQAMLFFHEIVRTPDAPQMADDFERFIGVQTIFGTKVIERKWLEDIGIGPHTDRLKVRGIEYDKVIALILLTQRNLGFTKYARNSIRIAFPDLEQIMMRDAKSALELPTLRLLNELLNNDVSALMQTPFGLMKLDPRFKVSSNEFLRFYAVLGSIVNLDVRGIEAKDNNSSQFRVISGFSVPKGEMAVVTPGADIQSANELKFWAADGAEVSDKLVGKTSLLSTLSAQKEALTPKFKEWVLAKTKELENLPELPDHRGPELRDPESEEPPKTGTEPPTSETESPKVVPVRTGELGPAVQAPPPEKSELEKLEEALDAELAKLPEAVGQREIGKLGVLLLQVKEMAENLTKEQPKMTPRDFRLQLDMIHTQLENFTRSEPILGIALSGLLEAAKDLELPILGEMIPYRVYSHAQLEQGLVFGNLQTLNEIFYILHPEYQP